MVADQLGLLKHGVVVHQSEPQVISRTPTDPYIANPISDIDRGRVLKVRSSCSQKIVPPAEDKLFFCGVIGAGPVLLGSKNKMRAGPKK